jgi:hypothetical protein
MADVDNKWSLFGLDLTRSGKWLALGVHQLMYDRGAWLLQRFDPSIRVTPWWRGPLLPGRRAVGRGELLPTNRPHSARSHSLRDAVLLKTLHLPASAEEDLDDAMPLEVGLSSPFAGYRHASGVASGRSSRKRD